MSRTVSWGRDLLWCWGKEIQDKKLKIRRGSCKGRKKKGLEEKENIFSAIF